MKLSKKLKKMPRGFGAEGVFRKVLHLIAVFFGKVVDSIRMMPKYEKYLTLLLFIVALTLSVIKAREVYIEKTNLVSTEGGIYTEAVVGELKSINPVYSQSDADKAVSELLFSGLVKIEKNKILADLAESWEISSGDLVYTFHLRKNVLFHDGSTLTANDVAYTIDQIKQKTDVNTRSPLFSAWENVVVNVLDDYTITFELPKPYGPFLYSCDFGVIPSYLLPDQFSKEFIGTGPYINESIKNNGGKISEIKLKSNAAYFGQKSKISAINLLYFENDSEAVKVVNNGKADSLFAADISKEGITDYSYNSGKQLGLMFNLRNDRFKDKEFRRKIISGEKMPDATKIRLVTLTPPIQKAKAEELKTRFAVQNIELELIYLNVVQLQDVLSTKEFEILLYGFDFSRDRDPYSFWHSSQIDANNFAGYSDKKSDILLEDARMLTDEAARNTKYDQFFNTIATEYIAEFYAPIKYFFHVSSNIKSIPAILGAEPGSRYFGIDQWYIKEKRVKK